MLIVADAVPLVEEVRAALPNERPRARKFTDPAGVAYEAVTVAVNCTWPPSKPMLLGFAVREVELVAPALHFVTRLLGIHRPQTRHGIIPRAGGVS